MVRNLAKAVDEETYFTKTPSDNTVRTTALSSEIYRKLIHYIQDEKIQHTRIKSSRTELIVS
jgi:hypothetical protein